MAGWLGRESRRAGLWTAGRSQCVPATGGNAYCVNLIAQIVVNPATANVLLAAGLACSGWALKKLFDIEKRLIRVEALCPACKTDDKHE